MFCMAACHRIQLEEGSGSLWHHRNGCPAASFRTHALIAPRQGLLATDSSPLSPSSGIAFCQRIWFLLCGSLHPEIGQYGRQSPMPLASRALFRTSSGQLHHSSAYPFAQSGSLHPPAAAFPNALSNKPACKVQRLRVRFLETPTCNA